MAEAMTVETIVEAYWQLQDFWTKVRYPFQPKGVGWSDIDILAYHPENKVLVIAESKVRGPKKNVYAYTKHSKKEYGSIFDFDDSGYLSFLDNIKPICSGGVIFKDFKKSVNKVVIQLVSNYYIDDAVLPEVKKDILGYIKKSIPKGIELEIRLDTTFDTICEIIQMENKKSQGRRYGHPVLDIAREVNRYLHPDIRYGKGKAEIDVIKNKFKDKFKKAIDL